MASKGIRESESTEKGKYVDADGQQRETVLQVWVDVGHERLFTAVICFIVNEGSRTNHAVCYILATRQKRFVICGICILSIRFVLAE